MPCTLPGCTDIRTRPPGTYYSSLVAADGKVYTISQEGKASVLKPGAQWEVLAVNDLEEECYATPALVDDRIYLRTHSRLYCFGQAPQTGGHTSQAR